MRGKTKLENRETGMLWQREITAACMSVNKNGEKLMVQDIFDGRITCVINGLDVNIGDRVNLMLTHISSLEEYDAICMA